jgi:hypothetical protein
MLIFGTILFVFGFVISVPLMLVPGIVGGIISGVGLVMMVFKYL